VGAYLAACKTVVPAQAGTQYAATSRLQRKLLALRDLRPRAANIQEPGMTSQNRLSSAALESLAIGEAIYALAADIFPICRSITGDGVRETLSRLSAFVPLTVHEVPTGTPVLDWTVPREWNIADAYVANAVGERVIDFRSSNLHVLNYSVPVRRRISLAELKPHIFTLPGHPDLIPYRTSYYKDAWGFCMAHRAFEALSEGEYEVVIDAQHTDGSLTYGEYLHPGESEDEVLLSAHVCHPSLANDNCSSLALLTHLAARLSQQKTRFSYRFLFAPGTIGAITWLARNREAVHRIKHGLVLSCMGDAGGPTYKRSRRGDAAVDRIMAHVLRHEAPDATTIDFFPYGYDERQFCSPGFNLPVGLLQRSQFGAFPEYHTSADNLDFIAPEHLAASWRIVARLIEVIEGDRTFLSTQPYGEPQLGRRGLYAAIGGDKDAPARNMAMLWTLNLSDGAHSLLDIAERANLPFAVVAETAHRLEEQGLLTPVGVPTA
jgi:aminopeptidase-like protein